MKSKPKKKSLVSHIVLVLSLVICIIFIAQNYLTIQSVQSSNANNYKDSCSALVQAYSKSVQYANNNFMHQLEGLIKAEEFEAINPEPSEIINFLKTKEKSRSEDFMYIAYVDASGTAYSDAGGKANVSQLSFYKSIYSDGSSELYGDPIKDPFSARWIIPIAKNYSNGNAIGFITVALPLSVLQEQIQDISFNGKGYAFVIAGDGTIIAHKDELLAIKNNLLTSEEFGLVDVATKMTSGEAGEAWFTNSDGKKCFVSFAPIEETSWSIGFVIEKEVINKSANSLYFYSIIQAVLMIVLLLTVRTLIKNALKQLNKVDVAIRDISGGNGNILQEIQVKNNDEIGSITDAFNSFVAKFQNTILNLAKYKDVLVDLGGRLFTETAESSNIAKQISENVLSIEKELSKHSSSADETANTVAKISENVDALERMISNQSASVLQASSAVEQMISNISSVNDSIEKMANSFVELEQKAQQGARKQEDVNARIEQIESQSKMLQEANTVIASIAAQTNLLAMNAAIEAAHAGESGKGFSVVADEIRKLSETSTNQSKTIGEQLGKIQESIYTVVTESSESSAAFATVAQNIQKTNQIVQQIKEAMTEQQEGSRQINSALQNMNSSTDEVRNASNQMAKGNNSVIEKIQTLQNLTTVIKSSINSMSSGIEKLNKKSSALSSISTEVKSAIAKINSYIKKFSV